MNDQTPREAVQAWRRHAVLHLLGQHGEQTAAEIAERFAANCQAEGISDGLWRGIDPNAMHGILRGLESAGSVTKAGEKHDGRAGRTAPTWAIFVYAEAPRNFPQPPDTNAPKPKQPTARSPHQAEIPVSTDVQHARAMLDGFDELAGITARHQQENERALRALSEVVDTHHRHAQELQQFALRMRVRLGIDG